MPKPPTDGGVTSPFGMRWHPITHTYRMHYGEDTIGVGNYAPVTGEVVYAAYDTTGMGFGNAVGIREDARPDHIWWVAHHESISVPLHSRTSEGATYLGPKGMTGAATGPHAHTECRVGGTARPGSGVAINPRPLYSGGGSSGGGSAPIGNEDDMAGAGLYGLFKRTDNGVTTLAVGSLTPGYETHDNYWAEAPADKRADWEAMFGPARELRVDVWNARSNDPKRIGDLSKFPFFGGVTLSPGSGPTATEIAKAVEVALADDFAGVMAAISQVDEATLATFGLKRA